MAKTKFFKVPTLPSVLKADAFYFVENSTYAESYVTNSSGVAKSIGNSTMINSLIDAKLTSLSSLEIVSNIDARDALNLTTNAMVLVTDASADSSVTSGAAMYVWDKNNSTFTKVTEYESLDVVLEWTSIRGRPTATPGDIDDTVNKKHIHANKVQLDKISEDQEGEILYGGDTLRPWDINNW